MDTRGKSSALALVAGFVFVLALGGCASVAQQAELTEKVTPLIETMRARHSDAVSELRVAAANPDLQAGLERRSPEEKVKAGPFISTVCTDSYKIVGAGLDILESNHQALTKLSKAPTDSFAGLTQGIKKDGDKLAELAALLPFQQRMQEALKEAKRAEDEAKGKGVDCTSVVRALLEKDLNFVATTSQVKSFMAEIAFIQAVADFAKKLMSLTEQKLRAEAVRQFIIKYEADFEYGLRL
ncbi:MAG: hypothetical protein ABI583_10445, partial [Betaproteobacteria bacterium]